MNLVEQVIHTSNRETVPAKFLSNSTFLLCLHMLLLSELYELKSTELWIL